MEELVKEEQQEVVDKSGSRNALTICLYVLAAVNLAVMLMVTQIPEERPSLEQVVWQTDAPRPQYLAEAGQGQYSFQSCTGGGSVNCHATGN